MLGRPSPPAYGVIATHRPTASPSSPPIIPAKAGTNTHHDRPAPPVRDLSSANATVRGESVLSLSNGPVQSPRWTGSNHNSSVTNIHGQSLPVLRPPRSSRSRSRFLLVRPLRNPRGGAAVSISSRDRRSFSSPGGEENSGDFARRRRGVFRATTPGLRKGLLAVCGGIPPSVLTPSRSRSPDLSSPAPNQAMYNSPHAGSCPSPPDHEPRGARVDGPHAARGHPCDPPTVPRPGGPVSPASRTSETGPGPSGRRSAATRSRRQRPGCRRKAPGLSRLAPRRLLRRWGRGPPAR